MSEALFGDRERAARYNPADPYLPFTPAGFESYTIRRWRERVDRHRFAEGISR